MAVRRQWYDNFKALKENKQTRNSYTIKVFFNNEGEINTFSDKQIERISHMHIYTKGNMIGYSF